MNQRGQSLVLTLVFLTVLAGSAAIVLDVGSWYRADRKLQANADAAALAGAQALPASPGEAKAAALAYAGTNDGGVASDGVSFRTTLAMHRITPLKPSARRRDSSRSSSAASPCRCGRTPPRGRER